MLSKNIEEVVFVVGFSTLQNFHRCEVGLINYLYQKG